MKQLQLSPTSFDYFKCVISEFLCTFIFAFFIYATACYTTGTALQSTIALFGLILSFSAIMLVCSFGNISGAHFNPAISFAAALGRKMSPVKALVYTVAQLAGATAAAGFLYAVFPYSSNLAAEAVVSAAPSASQFQACAMEAVLTFIFILVVYMVALGVDRIPYFMRINIAYERKFPLEDAEAEEQEQQEADSAQPVVKMPSSIQKGYYAGPAIGLTLGLLAMQGGTVSGGGFNPAVVFGSRLVSGDWGPVWLYWVGEYIGAALATGVYFLFFSNKFLQAESQAAALGVQ